MTLDRGVMMNATPIADPDVGTDHGAGTDFNISPNCCAGTNNGCFVYAHSYRTLPMPLTRLRVGQNELDVRLRRQLVAHASLTTHMPGVRADANPLDR